MIELFYYCHVEPNLLPIPSLSPRDGSSNWFKIRGKRAMPSPNPEKSTLRRISSPGVQNLWEKMCQSAIALQFSYAINLKDETV
jgi:hypothetical protein